MADITFQGDSGLNPFQTTEHYLRKVLTGDIKSVRGRLIAALERLGYDILVDDETVVRGRRQARGWGTSYSSADVLDYPMSLNIKLKEQGEHATRVTFDYVVRHPSLSRGEKEILTREAEAISALATSRAIDKICSACGTESTDDSRFCRRCGAKMSVESSELEVLRMSAEIRAGHTSVVATFIASMVSFLLLGSALLVAALSGVVFGKGIGALLIVGLVVLSISNIFICFGWNRVNRSLRRESVDGKLPSASVAQSLTSGAEHEFTGALPPASVTDRTTNLLGVQSVAAKTGEFQNDEFNTVKR